MFDKNGNPLLGILRLDSILPGSPAAKVGLQAGDLLVRLGELSSRADEGLLYTERISHLKAVLASATGEVRGVVARDGKLVPFTIPPGLLGAVMNRSCVPKPILDDWNTAAH